MINTEKTTVNNFSNVPLFPYKIIEYLIYNGSEDLWKLLKYQSVDALSRPILTPKEKVKLIWNGKDTQEQDYNIFLKPLVINSMDTSLEQCQIRLYRYDTTPENRYRAIIIYELDIITNEKSAIVTYQGLPCERTDLIETELLNSLNDCDIHGMGNLIFDRELSRTCKSLIGISNSKSFYGRSLFIGQRLQNNGV